MRWSGPFGLSIVVRLQQRPVTAALGVLAFVLICFPRHFRPHSVPFTSVSINQITNIGTIERIALSADGRFLAEVRNDKEQRTLWVRNTATSTDTRILDAFGNQYVGLTFSPDSNYLYSPAELRETTRLATFTLCPFLRHAQEVDRRYRQQGELCARW